MRKIKQICQGCGAEIRFDDEKCPYCGHPHLQHRKGLIREPKAERDVYEVDRESGTVRFGDGTHGQRPASGKDNMRATYRTGGGPAGTVRPRRSVESSRVVKCSACGTENKLGHKICINCSARL